MQTKTVVRSPGEPAAPIGPDLPWLAPLAGFSDLPFRLLCREQGAGAACTEMVSAKGLVYGLRLGPKAGAGSEELLRTTAADAPLVVQLFGAEPEFLETATTLLRERNVALFDLNMGCSVPKVTRTGAGAAMLREPALALKAARAMIRAAGPARVGFKLRLGWDASRHVYLDLARALEQEGAAWVTLHPRTARQGFSGTAEYAHLERLVRAVRIPVLASGDLFSGAAAARCQLETGVAGVMFARGALANPAVFAAYRQAMALARSGKPVDAHDRPLDAGALHALIVRHAELAQELTPGRPGRSGYAPGLLKMRTVVPRYVRHLPGARQLRLALTRCVSWEELHALLKEFFSRQETPDPHQCGQQG